MCENLNEILISVECDVSTHQQQMSQPKQKQRESVKAVTYGLEEDATALAETISAGSSGCQVPPPTGFDLTVRKQLTAVDGFEGVLQGNHDSARSCYRSQGAGRNGYHRRSCRRRRLGCVSTNCSRTPRTMTIRRLWSRRMGCWRRRPGTARGIGGKDFHQHRR